MFGFCSSTVYICKQKPIHTRTVHIPLLNALAVTGSVFMRRAGLFLAECGKEMVPVVV